MSDNDNNNDDDDDFQSNHLRLGLVSTQSYSKGDQLIATLPYYENDGLYTTINRQGIAYTTINKEKCEYCHEREEEYAT